MKTLNLLICLLTMSLQAENLKGLAYLNAQALGGALATVEGTSMEPELASGDVCVVVPAVEIAVGDVIQFRVPGWEKPWIHRVIGFKGERIRTQGANNPRPDGYLVEPGAVLGVVIIVFKQGVKG